MRGSNVKNRWVWTRERSRCRVALATLSLAQFVVVLNFQGASIALPEIQRVFGMSPSTAQWLISANALAFGGLLLVSGRAADLFGHRRLFALGLALFATTSLAVGLAPTASWLIVARAGQGIGTALFVPASLALLAGTFPEGPARHRALAMWGAAGPLGGVAAVLISGALVGVLGWSAIFVLSVPLALLSLGMTPGSFSSKTERGTGQLYPWGAVAGTVGIALLIYGLSEASRAGLTSASAAIALVVGIIVLAAFVASQRRTDAPLVPSALIGHGRILGAIAVAFLQGAATNTSLVFFALYMQQVRGASLLETGLGFVPANLAVIVGSTLGGRVVSRWGRATAMSTGMVGAVAGLLALTTISIDGTYAQTLLPGLALMGFGHGLAQVGIVAAAAAAADPAEQGIAAALVTTSAQLGTAVGLALLVAVASRVGSDSGPEHLVAGFQAAFLGGAGLALLGLMAALLSTRYRLSSDRGCLAAVHDHR